MILINNHKREININSIDSKNDNGININDDLLFSYYYDQLKDKTISFLVNIKPVNIRNYEIDEIDEVRFEKIELKKVFKLLIDEKLKSHIKQKIRRYSFQQIWPNHIRAAISYLRDKDTRDKGSWKFDFGVQDLTDYFNDFSKFEEILFGIDEYHRDHTIHVFRVYLLGLYIIDKIYPGDFKDIKIGNKEKEELKIEKGEKEAIWCIIALCHDLGYPLEKIERLNEEVLKIVKYFGSSNFRRIQYSLPIQGIILDEHILNFISSKLNKKDISEDIQNDKNNISKVNAYNLTIQNKYKNKYSNAYEKFEHGIISCILLMKNLVYFKESDYKLSYNEYIQSEDARQFLIRREILRSIASHECNDIYHIYTNNFSFLLIICDEIQEWGRPIGKNRIYHNGRDIKIKVKKYTKKLIDIHISTDFDKDTLKKYSIPKFKKFIKILRSAVHSERRPFDFKLTITNESIKYIFKYNSPDNEEDYGSPIVEKYDGKVRDDDFNIESIIEYFRKRKRIQ
ncbi:MAG: hypothetical protein GF329_10975 [Candidatus Lokiarchaeota archaeon]|nr:hypothetical protein [Candidatus Lokiarchaeota archaeon]